MRHEHYILNDKGEPVIEPDLITWARWMEKGERQVALTKIDTLAGQVSVSTVFLRLDHNWTGRFPVLWETMIFGGPHDQDCERCAGSREQAQAMHETTVQRLVSEDAALQNAGSHAEK